MINLQLLRELKKASLSFGVINVIIRGARIMALSNFIFASKKIPMDSWWKMRYLLELLHINLIAKIVLFGQILANFNLEVTDLNLSILAVSTLIRHHFLLVILFWKFLAIWLSKMVIWDLTIERKLKRCKKCMKWVFVELANLAIVFGLKNLKD